MNRKDGPCAMILSRQDLPVLDMAPADKRAGAAKELGAGCRVVSMPCVELFERQDAAYQKEVLPDKSITTACEAGVTREWYKYADKVLGVDSFGISAPAPFVFEAKGIT